MAKHGGPCMGAALRGWKHCRYHASPAVKCCLRLARLSRVQGPEQVKKAKDEKPSEIKGDGFLNGAWHIATP